MAKSKRKLNVVVLALCVVPLWASAAVAQDADTPAVAEETPAAQLPADAPVAASEEKIKANESGAVTGVSLTEAEKAKLNRTLKILTEEKKAPTTAQKIDQENVLRVRANVGAAGSNSLGADVQVGVDVKGRLKISDSKNESQGRVVRHVTTTVVEERVGTSTQTSSSTQDDRFCKKFGTNCVSEEKTETKDLTKTSVTPPRTTVEVESLDSGVRKRQYLSAQVQANMGVHAAGVVANAKMQGEYEAKASFNDEAVSLSGGGVATVQAFHNPLAPSFGAETVSVKGRVGVANDLVALSLQAGIGEVHVPGIYGIGLTTSEELMIDLAKAMKKVCSEDQECMNLKLRHEFFRNIPSATNINRATASFNLPLSERTSVEMGAIVTHSNLPLAADSLSKPIDVRIFGTLNHSWDVFPLLDRAEQATRLMDAASEATEVK